MTAATPARGATRAGAPDAKAVVAALMEEARISAAAGRRAIARQRYESALYLLKHPSDGPTACAILRRVGRLYLDDGDIASGQDCLTAALAIARQLGDASETAHTVNVLAISYWQRGLLEEATRLYQQASEMATVAGDARLVAIVEQNLGVIASMHGDLRQALEHYQRCLVGFRELGMHEETAHLLNNIGMAYAALEQWEEAESTYAEARTMARQCGVHLTRLIVDLNRVAMHIAQQEFSQAATLCSDVLADAEELSEGRILAEAYKHQGVIARETHNLGEAERLLTLAFDQAIEREDLPLAAETAREQAELYLALGRNRDTLKALSLSHRLFTRLQARRDLADVSRRLRLLEQRFEHLVGRYAQNIESKDAYTLGHCRRVADLACSVATEYGFDQPTMFWFRVGALLHDVGKVVVPSDILNKPGSLSPEERAIMERHPVAGVELLHDVEFPWDVIPMIRGHHERWDGHGYPDGLAGEDIPLAARILCVADVFDALTSQRPYRRAFAPQDALKLMRADAGRHFDPEILDRFLKVVTELPENETRMAEATRVASIA